MVSRREWLKRSLALPLATVLSPPSLFRSSSPHVAVVGAGAFGGWTALFLRRGGAKVTLLDAWGAGNSRASSGGETRVIRAVYRDRRIYVLMASRALTLWREHEARWGRKLYHRTGVLWMFQGDDTYARASLRLVREAGLVVEELALPETRRRYPQVDFEGVATVFHEPEAGYLTARAACEVVREALVAEGGEYRLAAATPGPVSGAEMPAILLSDGTTLRADRFVFACGPWLGPLFPEVIGDLVRPTRQEVFFFGVPAGDGRFSEEALPVWVDFGERFVYGIPGNERRGFKVADDTP